MEREQCKRWENTNERLTCNSLYEHYEMARLMSFTADDEHLGATINNISLILLWNR
jgi:hypothetical protein